MSDKEQDLVDFMLARLGGESAVLAEFYGFRLSEMAAEKFTIADVRTEAKRDKWIDHLDGMTLMGLVRAVIPSGSPKKIHKSRGVQTPRVEIEKQLDEVRKFISQNPWCKRVDITAGVGVEGRIVVSRIKTLMNNGEVQRGGTLRDSAYALAGAEPNKKKAPIKKGRARKVKKSSARVSKKSKATLTSSQAASQLGYGTAKMEYDRNHGRGPIYTLIPYGKKQRAMYSQADIDRWKKDQDEE